MYILINDKIWTQAYIQFPLLKYQKLLKGSCKVSLVGPHEYITHSSPTVLLTAVCISFLTDLYLSFIVMKVFDVPQLPQTSDFSAKLSLELESYLFICLFIYLFPRESLISFFCNLNSVLSVVSTLTSVLSVSSIFLCRI